MPKEKPPEITGAGSASLLALPKRKVDGGEVAGAGAGASFFSSSGFPNVNVGAAGFFSAGREPNVGPPGGVEAARAGVANTEEAAVVVVSVAAPSLPPLFSREEAGAATATDADEAAASCNVLSSGLGRPKLKDVLEEPLLSALDEPAANEISPPDPNLKPAGAASCSGFLSSPGAIPNFKPSVEALNLKPSEVLPSFAGASDEGFPNGMPNLNPPDEEEEEEDSEKAAPNLNPPEVDSEVLLEVPNVKPPDAEVVKDPWTSAGVPGLAA